MRPSTINKNPLPMVLVSPGLTYTETMAHFTALIHSRSVKIGSLLGNQRFNPVVSSVELMDFATKVSKVSGASFPVHTWAKSCVTLGYEPSNEEILAMHRTSSVVKHMIADVQTSYAQVPMRSDNKKISDLIDIMMSAAQAIIDRTDKEIVERQNEIDRANWYAPLS